MHAMVVSSIPINIVTTNLCWFECSELFLANISIHQSVRATKIKSAITQIPAKTGVCGLSTWAPVGLLEPRMYLDPLIVVTLSPGARVDTSFSNLLVVRISPSSTSGSGELTTTPDSPPTAVTAHSFKMGMTSTSEEEVDGVLWVDLPAVLRCRFPSM